MMRIENHHGNNIVCGHIYPVSELKVGQKWQDSVGSIVEIIEITDDWVIYAQCNDSPHTKSSFAFQCRYCLILSTE